MASILLGQGYSFFRIWYFRKCTFLQFILIPVCTSPLQYYICCVIWMSYIGGSFIWFEVWTVSWYIEFFFVFFFFIHLAGGGDLLGLHFDFGGLSSWSVRSRLQIILGLQFSVSNFSGAADFSLTGTDANLMEESM